LNTAIVNYGTALQMLASPDLIDAKTFDKLATDLNGNIAQAATLLDVTEFLIGTEKFKADGIALFSTIAAEAARGIIEQHRKNQLINILKENQQKIAAVSAIGYQGASNLGSALRNEYGPRATTMALLSSGLTANRGLDPSATEQSRRKAFEQLMALNKLFVTELEAIDTLHRAYETLPLAHAGMTMELEKPSTGWAAIQELFREGQRLYALYEELRKANEKAAKQPEQKQ